MQFVGIYAVLNLIGPHHGPGSPIAILQRFDLFRRRTGARLLAVLKSTPQGKMSIPALLNANILPRFARTSELSLALNSSIHVQTCFIYIQGSWRNLGIVDSPRSIASCRLHRQDRCLSSNTGDGEVKPELLVRQAQSYLHNQ